ncbi:MAG: hypothetical protein WCD37_17060 [Chloroflexia bacterium]
MEQKGRLHKIVLEEASDLHESINQAQAHQKAMLKDIHLIQAAIQTDRAIVSGDEKAHGMFAAMTSEIKELRSIVWIDAHDEYVITWVQGGALWLKEHTLEAHAARLEQQ